MKRSTTIAIGGTAVLLVIAAFTIFNRKWWGHRITAKWDVHTGTDPKSPWTIYGPDFQKWSLAQLVKTWKDGEAGWYPKGKTPDLPTGSEFNVA